MDFRLVSLAFRQVGDDQANGGRPFGPQRDGRHQRRKFRGVAGREDQLGASPAFAQHRGQQPAVRRGDGLLDPAAHDLLQGQLEHLGETVVAVVDDPLRSDRCRPFAHLFDQGPIGVLAALEREHPLPVGRVDHQRVDRPLADGAEGLLGVGQLGL